MPNRLELFFEFEHTELGLLKVAAEFLLGRRCTLVLLAPRGVFHDRGAPLRRLHGPFLGATYCGGSLFPA